MKQKVIFRCFREDLKRECVVVRDRKHYALAIFKTDDKGNHLGEPYFTAVTRPTCSRKNAIEAALRVFIKFG